jgi:hypothetical protein
MANLQAECSVQNLVYTNQEYLPFNHDLGGGVREVTEKSFGIIVWTLYILEIYV